MPDITRILARSEAILLGKHVTSRKRRFSRYAISNFRGGIGKSTLAFNLAYELSRKFRTLLLDTCSQRNFTQNLMGDAIFGLTPNLYDALVNGVTAGEPIPSDELAISVSPNCPSFKGGKPTYLIPGSTELFLFPSLMYGQLAQFAQLGDAQKKRASQTILKALDKIVAQVSEFAKPDKILIDTSPFFGGATHLAWEAAEALIIPVRVDQHSIEALRLTLDMLTKKQMDFHRFNEQAGFQHKPVVHAIVMTHCGWNRQRANTPDSSTKFFVEAALEVAEQYNGIFSEKNPDDCFYLLDDFHSSGRISGQQRIPLAELKAGRKFMVDGQRLEVNPSVDRYQKEMESLTLDL
ncbi:ParA family protein [Xanthobacter sp.]|uniref:ParA family protein n=1 Tax=Xanthobacter sp. TaxID=35809 RepID=UPI0025DC2907|nr:ParA family protein [Xanthobacter sp.]